MADVVDGMVSCDSLMDNGFQTYQHFIRVVKILLQRSIIFNIIEYIGEKEKESRKLGITHLDDELLFSSRTEEVSLLVYAASDFAWNHMKQHPFHALSFYNSKSSLLRELHGL